MVAVRIIVTGKVQGVFFRQSALSKALDLKLRGFVMNQPDGSVLIEAIGEEENIQSLFEWCHRGPLPAKVEKVHKVQIDFFAGYDTFLIKK